MKKTLFLLYAIICYGIFFLTFLYLVGFVGNIYVQKSIDLPNNDGMSPSLGALVDLALITLFGLQHSVMARQEFKRRWTRFIPEPIERSTYVLVASIILIILFNFWQPIPTTLWSLEGTPGAAILTIISFLGWGIVLLSTFLINHFHLFGLVQAINPQQKSELRFRTPFFYKFVRHPLYLGFLIAFWSAPVMSVGHLLFSIAMTVYIFIGIWHEERDLSNLYGARYEQYKRTTSKIIPMPTRPNS